MPRWTRHSRLKALLKVTDAHVAEFHADSLLLFAVSERALPSFQKAAVEFSSKLLSLVCVECCFYVSLLLHMQNGNEDENY